MTTGLFEKIRKKAGKPVGGGDSSLETEDLSEQVPKTEDILARLNGAIEKAEKLEAKVKPEKKESDYCGCF